MSMRESWRGVRVALVVGKEGVDAHRVAAAVELVPELLTDGSHVESTADRWTWNVRKGETDTLEVQTFALVTQIHPRLESLLALQRDGYAVHVDIAGTAETGSTMAVPPALLSELASLGTPVTFTCLTEAGVPESDPLSWLDG
ncbi:hypothetical protein [Streptomyces sp. AP-93]|uniref:hypothetical protein n=1 Tax=Streptomyces sp. AP-93 TaxID=2929048 RepID=UPI001FAEB254|nr:hypothetical protein [Streptomyces sp. AP-93]MCJ0874591.1 hypothetical protein [Streptomyces sp. AP-93]